MPRRHTGNGRNFAEWHENSSSACCASSTQLRTSPQWHPSRTLCFHLDDYLCMWCGEDFAAAIMFLLRLRQQKVHDIVATACDPRCRHFEDVMCRHTVQTDGYTHTDKRGGAPLAGLKRLPSHVCPSLQVAATLFLQHLRQQLVHDIVAAARDPRCRHFGM